MKLAEHVARAMCQREGFDPETSVTQMQPIIGPRGSFVWPGPEYRVPAWFLYMDLADAALNSFKDYTATED